MAEQRGFTRVRLSARASLDLPDGTTVVGEVADLAVGGLRLLTLARPEPGLVVPFTVVFGDGEDCLVIRGSGHVARVLPDSVAVAFDQLDLEGYEHISRLVLYNADDFDAVEQELRAHVGLKLRG